MLIYNPLSTFAETERKKPDGRFTLESFVTNRRGDGFRSGRAGGSRRGFHSIVGLRRPPG